MVKNLPANAGDTGDTGSNQDPLEKEMATHSSILDWKIPWTAEPGYRPWGCKDLDTTEYVITLNSSLISLP